MKLLFIVLSSFLFISCVQSDKVYVFNGKTMGTYYSVKIVASDIDKENTQLQIDELLKEVNQVFSTYINNSEVSKINAHRSPKPISITPVMEQLLKLSKEIYEKSDRFFDPTVGPLVNLWGFGPDGKRYKPRKEEIENALRYVGLDKISILNGQVTKRESDIYLDFSSIAKGQGVDDLGLVLESRGFTSYLIEIGGEIRARGKKPDGNLWSIGIEKPSKERGQSVQKVLKLKNESIATSGSYRNYLKYGESIFSHTISPKTGYPIKHKLLSVSVIDKNCANADAWATALMSLGPEKGLDKANRLGLKAYFLVKDGSKFKEILSDSFKSR
jgi:thiamine biosynthesis lipoprotein